jgi:hypothetical protein
VPPTVICGIVALGQPQGGGGSGSGMAISGLLISVAWLLPLDWSSDTW